VIRLACDLCGKEREACAVLREMVGGVRRRASYHTRATKVVVCEGCWDAWATAEFLARQRNGAEEDSWSPFYFPPRFRVLQIMPNGDLVFDALGH
jgi:hypothetical protein